VRDTFTRGDITRQALALQIMCVTEGMDFLGGRMKVGRGVFEVYLMDGMYVGAIEGAGREKRRNIGGEDVGRGGHGHSVTDER